MNPKYRSLGGWLLAHFVLSCLSILLSMANLTDILGGDDFSYVKKCCPAMG